MQQVRITTVVPCWVDFKASAAVMQDQEASFVLFMVFRPERNPNDPKGGSNALNFQAAT